MSVFFIMVLEFTNNLLRCYISWDIFDGCLTWSFFSNSTKFFINLKCSFIPFARIFRKILKNKKNDRFKNFEIFEKKSWLTHFATNQEKKRKNSCHTAAVFRFFLLSIPNSDEKLIKFCGFFFFSDGCSAIFSSFEYHPQMKMKNDHHCYSHHSKKNKKKRKTVN